MSEETALEPVLERPLAYLVRLGNLHAFAGFEGNRQFVVDGTLLFREAGERIMRELPVRFDGRCDKVVTKADGTLDALQTDFLQFTLTAAVANHLQYQGKSDAVSLHLRGHSCKGSAAIVLLPGQIIEPVVERLLRFGREPQQLRLSVILDAQDSRDNPAPFFWNIPVNLVVIQFRIPYLVGVGEQPAVNKAA